MKYPYNRPHFLSVGFTSVITHALLGKHEKSCKSLAERVLFANFFELISKRKMKFEENNFNRFHLLSNKKKRN